MELAFHLTRFHLTVGFMTPPDDFQACQGQDSPLSLMLNSRHVLDLATVNALNLGALVVSLSEAEQWIRVTGCLLAAVYTSLKIFETLKALKK